MIRTVPRADGFRRIVGAGEFRKRWLAFQREEKRLAIRCVFCLHVFCRKCAKKHFQPRIRRLDRTERAMDKILAEIVEANMARLGTCRGDHGV